jgi:uncharacterized protein YegP (UPF0339 family)
MAIYTIKRTTANGETTQLTRTYNTARKANNGFERVQENSSRSSTIRLYEDDKCIRTGQGLN